MVGTFSATPTAIKSSSTTSSAIYDVQNQGEHDCSTLSDTPVFLDIFFTLKTLVLKKAPTLSPRNRSCIDFFKKESMRLNGSNQKGLAYEKGNGYNTYEGEPSST